MAKFLAVVVLAIPQLLAGQSSVARELLAFKPGTTAKVWLAQHPHDKFELYPGSERQEVLHEWCAVATASTEASGTHLVRHAYFYIPEARDLALPKDYALHPELTRQCRMEEIRIEFKPATANYKGQLVEISSELERTLGTPRPFKFDPGKGALLIGSNSWTDGEEWNGRDSRWIVAIDPSRDPSRRRLVALALSPIANERQSPHDDSLDHRLGLARRFLPTSGMSQIDRDHMSEILGAQTTVPGAAAQFLVSWVKQNDKLPKESRAANFFIADAALDHNASLPHPIADDPEAKNELASAGARFQHDELGGNYVYMGDWRREAWQTAPESEPGMASFLLLLDQSFELGCCCPAGFKGYENVIREGTRYLDSHPHSPIRVPVTLRVADAWKDKVVLGFDPETTGFEITIPEAEKAEAFQLALKYYREVIASAPNSEEARQARTTAWRLLAGVKSLPTRFVCLYD